MERKDFIKVEVERNLSVLASYSEVLYAYGNLYLVKSKETNLYGFINSNLEEVVPCLYSKLELKNFILKRKQEIKDFDSSSLKVCQQDGMVGYGSSIANLVIPLEYQKGLPFQEDLACVKYEGAWGFIDKTNSIIIPFQYEMASSFSNGLAPVKTNGKWGFIDRNNEFIISPTYDYVDSFRFGFALVKEGLEYFFINSKGQKMLTKLLETRFIQTKEDIPKDALNVKILEYLSIIEFLDQTVIVNDKDKKNYLKNLLKVEGLELSDRIKVLKK